VADEATTMSPRLGFTGDVMLGRNVDRTHRGGTPEAVWGDVLSRLRGLDGLFVNLECALSTRGREWTRTYRPFHFRAAPDWAIPALRAAGVDWTALANNHLLDYEEVALHDTVDHLDDAGIAHAGAGADERRAFDPSVVGVGDLRVGLLSLTDNTPEYAAGPDTPGVARIEMDVADAVERERVRDLIANVRERGADLVVASLHWGPNMVVVPADRYRTFGRWLIESGVDLVHGHSAHVFQGVERHEGGLLLHDCGDFVDDYRVDEELRNDQSFLFELAVTADGELERLRLHPTEIGDCVVDHANERAAAWARETMRDRTAALDADPSVERAGDGLALAL